MKRGARAINPRCSQPELPRSPLSRSFALSLPLPLPPLSLSSALSLSRSRRTFDLVRRYDRTNTARNSAITFRPLVLPTIPSTFLLILYLMLPNLQTKQSRENCKFFMLTMDYMVTYLKYGIGYHTYLKEYYNKIT